MKCECHAPFEVVIFKIAQRLAKSLHFLQLLTRILDVLCCIQALAEALKINSSVRDINLGHNKIGAEGAQARPVSDVLWLRLNPHCR